MRLLGSQQLGHRAFSLASSDAECPEVKCHACGQALQQVQDSGEPETGRLSSTASKGAASLGVILVLIAGGLFVKSKLKTPEQYLDEIVEYVFDQCDVDNSGSISHAELYVGVLLVYNEINRRFPGYHDPPTSEEVMEALMKYDMDGNGTLDRHEFAQLAHSLGDLGGAYMKLLAKQLAWTCAALPAAAYGIKRLLALRIPQAEHIPVFLLAPVLGGVLGGCLALMPMDFSTRPHNRLLPLEKCRERHHAQEGNHRQRAGIADMQPDY
eukprot:CAMPEP_0114549744 /NCGR_PEP_ID=MMETSP0114-20121206/5688_1 /TAXON_ID=31324 /ORGANISM="Goniomonas sp, Strain m" /LENGTH=267 /DNA_ID=CAMNT_0001734441 /DNA_START=202 /DNA_END=1005 /DNA_ORIENTATION=-